MVKNATNRVGIIQQGSGFLAEIRRETSCFLENFVFALGIFWLIIVMVYY